MGEAASDPDDETTAGPDAAGARGLGSTGGSLRCGESDHQAIRANLAAGSPDFLPSSGVSVLRRKKRREHNMRLFLSLASARLGSRHLMFGVETLLALTLCLLVLSTVTQL
jgi:hypothetical protein